MFELLATVEGFDLDVGDLVARLAEAQPGPQVVMVLAALDAPPAAAAAAAPPGAASGAVGPVELAEGDPDWTREEVAAALRLSGQTAHRRLTVARTLEHQLPGTWAALAEGRISYLHAAAVAEAVTDLDDAAASAVQTRVLRRAHQQSLAELRRALRRAVLAADPGGAEQAHRRAVDERRVDMWPTDHGMAELRALLPAEDATTVMTALDTLAHHTPSPNGTGARPGAGAGAGAGAGIDARRADALVALATAALADPTPPRRRRARPHIQVTVAATTLLDLDDQPAELAGYGPITAHTARRIAADGTWRRLLTDPTTGTLLDYGRTTYRPPADLTQHVTTRDQVCRFPHCNTPAHHADLDHTTPYPQGPTNPDNLTALCRRHHRATTKPAGNSTPNPTYPATPGPAPTATPTTPPHHPSPTTPTPTEISTITAATTQTRSETR